ncbi:MAG: hypothetical protein KGY42_06465, partial [Desulfobacterales bacterium]|nr:hypothetical protein [Desulfobacterales bacterium]
EDLGLRQAGGIDIPGFEGRFGVDFQEMFGPAAAPFINSGKMGLDAQCCRLTREGMLLLDTIAAELSEIIE